jgi:hypothetical protein
MPVNSQIPMMMDQFQPATAQLNAQSYQQHMQDAQLKQQEIAVGQQNMRNQMFLSQVASEPGSLDPKTGLWSQDAIDKIVKGNPILGRDILQKQTKDKMTLETLALDQGKVQLESHKVKSEAINDEQMQAIAAADVAPADQREQVYAKEWTAGRDRLSKSGIFSADTQFGDMSYRQAKEIALRRTSNENKNPVQQVEDARDQVNDLKTEYTHMEPNSPQAKQLLQKISDGEAAIKRMTAPTAPMVSLDRGDKVPSGYREKKDGTLAPIKGGPADKDKVPSGYEQDPANPGGLRPIKGGPADKDKRDVMQADALAAYRAAYPLGEFDGKSPKVADYVDDYIKKKEAGEKGLPRKNDIAARFSADKEMKGMTLGKKTDKGTEVLDKNGKLVGHYQ